jgi:hypothetical protein
MAVDVRRRLAARGVGLLPSSGDFEMAVYTAGSAIPGTGMGDSPTVITSVQTSVRGRD